MDPILVLAYLAIILLGGILCAFISKELKLPYNLILLLLGLFLGSLSFEGTQFIRTDPGFIIGIGTLALILLVFDSTSRLKVQENVLEASASIKLINAFSILSILIVSLVVANIFFPILTLEAILYSILFSVMVVETDLGSVLLIFRNFAKDRSKKLLLFLETEANLNTAFVIILPFIILNLINNVDFTTNDLMSAVYSRIPEFIYQIIIGVGVGIVFGLVLLRFMKNWYSQSFSPIVLFAACLASYVFSGLIGGNGIISVAIMGLFFGNTYVSGKEQLTEFSSMLSNGFEIIIFIMLGMAVKLPISFDFVAKTLLIFLVIIAVRLVSVFVALRKESFSNREKIFIGFNMPKGLALATVALVLSTLHLYTLTVVLQVLVMIMIYSIVLSYILDFKAHKMLGYEATSENYKSGLNVLETNIPRAVKISSRNVSRSTKSRRKSFKKLVKKKASKKSTKRVAKKTSKASNKKSSKKKEDD